MRDLYTRLKVSKSAPVSALERVIESCADAKLKEDARVVLLNPQLREAYDQAHGALCNIGALRANLGLLHSSTWSGTFASDFSASPSRNPSQLELFHRKLKQNNQPSSAPDENGFAHHALNFLKSHPLLTVIVLLVGFALFQSLFEEDNRESKSNTPQQSTSHQNAQNTPADSVRGAFDDLIPGTNRLLSSPTGSRTGTRPTKRLQPLFQEPELPSPQSGEIRVFCKSSRIAPFEIKTSQEGGYLVKLVNAQTKADIMTVFVRGGSTIEVEVPLGVFEVRYAYGEKWYGYEHLFGPDTVYSKAETTFDFNSNGNQVSGYTITLYRVRNGNLETSRISAQEF